MATGNLIRQFDPGAPDAPDADSLLNKSGNKRSNTEVPDGWVMPVVGPDNYVAA